MAAIINIRWQQRDGSFFIRLVASKSRVGLIWSIETSRMELNGVVLMMRLSMKLIKAVVEKPEQLLETP